MSEHDLADLAGETETTNLMGCPSCGNAVSVFAHTCPHCGHPFQTQHQQSARPRPPRKQLIEKTSKGHKLVMLLGVLIMLPSGVILAMALFGWSDWLRETAKQNNIDPPVLFIGSLVAFVAGMIIYLLARFTAWWQHG